MSIMHHAFASLLVHGNSDCNHGHLNRSLFTMLPDVSPVRLVLLGAAVAVGT